MKRFLKEFKEFISRGSVIDLAVGIVVGGAFTAIVTSLVNDVIMPAIGFIMGGIDFTGLKLVLTPAADGAGEVAIMHGNFIQSIVNFLLIALVIFIVVKAINRFRTKKDAAAAAPAPKQPTEEVLLLREIRDLMRQDHGSSHSLK